MVSILVLDAWFSNVLGKFDYNKIKDNTDMKKVLTLTLILGSFGMMNAQKTIPSALMTIEYQASDAVKGDTKLPLAVSGYEVEGDTKYDAVKGDTKLPLAVSGYEVENTPKIKKNDFPFYFDAKVTLDDFNVYPTIANDVVHITSNVDGIVRVVVYSLTGELKKNTRFEGSYDLDVTSYPHGTYVVRIGRASEVFTFKFIR